MFRTIIADPNPALFEKTGMCQKGDLFFVKQTFEELDHTDILQKGIACIANAGNSHGIMGAGVAGAIQRRYGNYVKWNVRTAIAHGLLDQKVGSSYVVKLGPNAKYSQFKYCAYTITMMEPGQRLNPADDIPYLCMLATLQAVKRHNYDHPFREIRTLVVSGFGTGVGGLDAAHAGKAMVEAYDEFHGSTFPEIWLDNIDPPLDRTTEA